MEAENIEKIQANVTTNQNSDDSFREERLFVNVNRIYIITRIFLVIISWLFVINLVGIILHHQRISSMYLHAVIYSILILVNLYFQFVFHPRTYQKNINSSTIRYYENMVIFYISIVMISGSVISIVDQIKYEHLIIIMVNMLVCSSFFLMTNKQIFIPFSLSTIILLVGLPMVDSSSFDYYIQLYYVVTFVSVTLLVSRVMYKAFCDNYESNRRLKKEIETNHLLNQRLKEANQRLEIIASIDELTKISNRRGLHIHMDNLESNLNDNQQKFSSIVMDIDYFKKYNDYYGHNPGDKVLENIAGVLSGIAKDTSGFVARWGGEEFVYIICGENMEQIGSVCKRVQEAVYNLKIPHPQSEVSNYVTLSMGACSSNVSNRKEMQKCIEQADKALYNVKTGGRNGYSYVSMIVE